MNRQILAFIAITAVLVAGVGVLTFVDSESKEKKAYDPIDDSGIEEIAEALGNIDFLRGYDESEAKARTSDMISGILTIIEREEAESKKDVKIDGSEHVRDGDSYTLGYGNTYSFAKGGSIDVQEGGTLILGNNFVITGSPAVFNLGKGSSVNIMGSDVVIPFDLVLKIDGSLAYRFTCTSDISATTANLSVNGYSDLDGSISFGQLKIDSSSGKEFSMKMTACIALDPSSAITNVMDIPTHEFEAGNGVDLQLDIEELNVDIGPHPLYARINMTSVNLTCGSPLGSTSFNISRLEAEMMNVKIGSEAGLMDILELTAEGIETIDTTDGIRISVVSAEREVKDKKINEGMHDTLGYVRASNDAELIMRFGERLNLTLCVGNFETIQGRIDADVEIKAEASVSWLFTKQNGDLTVRDGASFSAFLDVPFRRDSHIVIAEPSYDIRFAEDQEAYLELVIQEGLPNNVEIIPDESYGLSPYESGEYVHYTVDDTEHGIPVSSIESQSVTFYAALGDREYKIYLDNGEMLKGTAGTIVDLPVPDPVEGMDFIGWTDSIGIYRDQYTIPALNFEMAGLWSAKTNAPAVDSGKCTISSNSNAITIGEAEIESLKTKAENGEFETLVLSANGFGAEMDKDVLLSVSGGLRFIPSYVTKVLKPEWAKYEGASMMINILLEDDEGALERIGGRITVYATYDALDGQYDRFRTYSVDDDGELSGLDCTFEIKSRTDHSYDEDITVRYADLTIDTAGSQFILVEPYDTGTPTASKFVLVYALIAIAATGAVLAWITKRR